MRSRIALTAREWKMRASESEIGHRISSSPWVSVEADEDEEEGLMYDGEEGFERRPPLPLPPCVASKRVADAIDRIP